MIDSWKLDVSKSRERIRLPTRSIQLTVHVIQEYMFSIYSKAKPLVETVCSHQKTGRYS